MFDNVLILSLLVFVIIVPVTFGLILRSETFAQKYPSLIAAFKGLIFYGLLTGIYLTVQLIFPSFTLNSFLLGLFIGSVGSAVFAHRTLLLSQKRKPPEVKLDLGEDKLKTLLN